MTVLQALDRYYDRMKARGEAQEPGYGREKIGFAIVLDSDGSAVDVIDLRDATGRKPVPRLMDVPSGGTRTSGIAANFLWDKSAYVLGRTAGAGKRTADEHAAFRALHFDLLADTQDAGLLALRRFLEGWTPDRFDAPPFAADMLDANLVFRLAGEHRYLHEREAAQALVAGRQGSDAKLGFCLVSGRHAPVSRLHPTVRGVEGAQSSGAALVSFNQDSFASYGKEQGANAPTSEAAAFRYGAALNRMLDRGGRNRVARPIGDATTLFWAEAPEAAAAAAEDFFQQMLNPPDGDTEQDAQAAAKLWDVLKLVAAGRPVAELDPRLADDVRFFVLGLSPNAGRLSVRFWLADSFDAFARRLARHHADLVIEPRPWRGIGPPVNLLLARTTSVQEKFENIPPLLAGEVMRAILGGTPYPRSLLAAAVIRLRAGDDPATGWHAAVIRAVLARTTTEETPPVALDRESTSPAYQLGRMFAMAEIAQRMALGKVNATIRDRYFGAASATPASVFPLLLRGMQNHLSRLRKDGKGGFIERELDEIVGHMGGQFPRALRLEDQGRFVIGYYHQRRARVGGKPVDEIADEESPQEGNAND